MSDEAYPSMLKSGDIYIIYLCMDYLDAAATFINFFLACLSVVALKKDA